MYSRLKSGAESGWDYSSRWFIATDQDSESAGELSRLINKFQMFEIIKIQNIMLSHRSTISCAYAKYCTS